MSKTKNLSASHHKKRYGKHKKHSDSFRKVYWPYLPMLVMLLVVLVFGNTGAHQLGKVLGASASISELGLLTETNSRRKAAEIPVLTINAQLSRAAQEKAQDMATRNYWSHNTPENTEPWSFIEAQDYRYTKAGENLAYGFTTDAATITGWMESQSHRDNMLDGTFQEVGFGILQAENYQNSGVQTVVVALYATPAQQTSTVAAANNSPVRPIKQVSLVASTGLLQSSWLNFVVGAITGLAAAFMITRHGLRLKRAALQGEHFVMHHPVLDLSVTGIVVIGVLLLQTVGVIG